MTPKRIQRQRTKGWRMPEGAVYVGRPTKWGNPFVIGNRLLQEDLLFPYLARTVPGGASGFSALQAYTAQAVVEAHGWWLIEQPALMLSLNELRGKDLACWCALDAPCHADILLELANAPTQP